MDEAHDDHDPIDKPFMVVIPSIERWAESYRWCEEKFGPCERVESKKKTSRWDNIGTVYDFKNEDDAFEFKMRWA